MRVHFWGTRGSLPVALTSDGVQRKLRAALEHAIRLGIRDVETVLADSGPRRISRFRIPMAVTRPASNSTTEKASFSCAISVPARVRSARR